MRHILVSGDDAANFRDDSGSVDQPKFADHVLSQVAEAIGKGRAVYLLAGAQRVRIVDARGGMLRDEYGKTWSPAFVSEGGGKIVAMNAPPPNLSQSPEVAPTKDEESTPTSEPAKNDDPPKEEGQKDEVAENPKPEEKPSWWAKLEVVASEYLAVKQDLADFESSQYGQSLMSHIALTYDHKDVAAGLSPRQQHEKAAEEEEQPEQLPLPQLFQMAMASMQPPPQTAPGGKTPTAPQILASARQIEKTYQAFVAAHQSGVREASSPHPGAPPVNAGKSATFTPIEKATFSPAADEATFSPVTPTSEATFPPIANEPTSIQVTDNATFAPTDQPAAAAVSQAVPPSITPPKQQPADDATFTPVADEPRSIVSPPPSLPVGESPVLSGTGPRERIERPRVDEPQATPPVASKTPSLTPPVKDVSKLPNYGQSATFTPLNPSNVSPPPRDAIFTPVANERTEMPRNDRDEATFELVDPVGLDAVQPPMTTAPVAAALAPPSPTTFRAGDPPRRPDEPLAGSPVPVRPRPPLLPSATAAAVPPSRVPYPNSRPIASGFSPALADMGATVFGPDSPMSATASIFPGPGAAPVLSTPGLAASLAGASSSGSIPSSSSSGGTNNDLRALTVTIEKLIAKIEKLTEKDDGGDESEGAENRRSMWEAPASNEKERPIVVNVSGGGGGGGDGGGGEMRPQPPASGGPGVLANIGNFIGSFF